MGLLIENKLLEYIKKYKTATTTEDKEILRYGIQICYFNISKLLILLLTSVIFGLFKAACISFILIAILKRYAYGFHANTFWSCLIISFINIFGIICLSRLEFNPIIKIVLAVISVILFTLYAPADTEEQPLVNSKKRTTLKIHAVIVTIIYIIFAFFTDGLLSNMFILSLTFVGLNTSPILYRLFKKEYRNYEKFI